MMILPWRSIMVALISPAFSFFRISTGSSPLMILPRISGTHLGHSESVSRGQPSFGFCFSQLLSSGLSDHLGVNDGFGRMELIRSKTNQPALAARATAFSTCLIGLVKSDLQDLIFYVLRATSAHTSATPQYSRSFPGRSRLMN